MASDRLYELALEYRKTGLWKRMMEDQLFAVRLDGGRIGYVSVMGLLGEHIALALYVGEEGLKSYHILREYEETPLLGYSPAFLNHASIQVSFDRKDDLAPEDLAAARDYAKRTGHQFRGKNAYPWFFKVDPGYTIWPELTQQDENDLQKALEAAIEVAGDETLNYNACGEFVPIDRESEDVVLLEKDGKAWRRSRSPLPKVPEYTPPKGESWDELAVSRVRKLPKKGTWQMGLITVAEPVTWENSDKPIVPTFLMVLDKGRDQLISVRPVALYESRTHVMLNMLMNGIEEYGSRPARIEVEDEYTEALLTEWCGKLQIKLLRKDLLAELREAKGSFVMHLGGPLEAEDQIEEMAAMIDELMSLPPLVLEQMPKEMKEMLFRMEEEAERTPDFPEWLLERLEDLLDEFEDPFWDDEIPGDRRKPAYDRGSGPRPKMCVLSLSLGKGCYRHLRISEDVMLEDLAEVILWAFGFVNDHAHAFFMDNRIWSRADSYYMAGIDPWERTTDQYRLQDTGLYKDKQFKFVFDFGDEWVFQCKVLQTGLEAKDDEQLDSAEIIRTKGEPPAQYGWDLWDEDEDE